MTKREKEIYDGEYNKRFLKRLDLDEVIREIVEDQGIGVAIEKYGQKRVQVALRGK